MRARLVAVLLSLSLLWSPLAWAASKQYVNPGSGLVFGDSGQTPAALWTLSNLASGTGRMSARYDKNPLASPTGAMPALWEMRCRISLTGTNTIGQVVEYYIATSDGTDVDSGGGTADAAIVSDQRRNLTLAGVLLVTSTASNTVYYATFRGPSGIGIPIPSRYFSLAIWNSTALPTQTSGTAHRCLMTPMNPEMQ